MRKPKLDNIVTTRRVTIHVCNNTWQHWKRARPKVNLRTHRPFPCHHFSSIQRNLQHRMHRWQDKLQQQHQHQRYNVKPYCKVSGQIPAVTLESA